MTRHRCREARERAGLSIAQASLLTGIPATALSLVEADPSLPLSAREVSIMSDYYAVRPEWLSGQCEQYDFESVDKIKGAEYLTPHDRWVIAEFVASMPRRCGVG